ncbi:MAG: hypothetical protein JRJ84_03840 [Deltaproteobacteria bacterium]|nr:hypothetical protein [Deltaproteobacteria bacterium]
MRLLTLLLILGCTGTATPEPSVDGVVATEVLVPIGDQDMSEAAREALLARLSAELPTVERTGDHPCGAPSPGLTKALRGPGVAALVFDYAADVTGAMGVATSALAPSGSKPEPLPTDNPNDIDYDSRVQQWACTYAPARAFDQDPATAWVEGVAGAGIGQAIAVAVDPQQPVEIWAGYGKSDAVFTSNARPRQVRVTTLQAHRMDYAEGTVEGAEIFGLVQVVDSHVVELLDQNAWQPLALPTKALDAGVRGLISIEILTTFPGAKYQDTCISEVRNTP